MKSGVLSRNHKYNLTDVAIGTTKKLTEKVDGQRFDVDIKVHFLYFFQKLSTIKVTTDQMQFLDVDEICY